MVGVVLMKWLNRLLAVVVVLLTINVFVQPDSWQTIGKRVNNAVDLPAMLKTEIDRTTTRAGSEPTTQTDSTATPIESIVQGRRLSSRYYYQFADDVPAKAKRIFLEAINQYNQTGIVHILPVSEATNRTQANIMTLYVYQKRVAVGSGAVELGLGGPKVYPWVGKHNEDINRGKAGLNTEYPQSSLTLSVSLHEIGHVLGLDHSRMRSSIMYPIDQGKTKLSAADLATLRKIYQH